MPRGLARYQQSGQSHFVTFCCFHRRASLGPAPAKQAFEAALERVRRRFGLCVFGYVVMPEHVHLLVSEPERETLAEAIKSLKQGVARRLIGEAEHFWQKRYYDFNIRNHRQFVEKLRYIHRNPVGRESGAMAVEQLLSLRDWRGRSSRDRVGVDGQPARAGGGQAVPTGGSAPLKPKDGLSGGQRSLVPDPADAQASRP